MRTLARLEAPGPARAQVPAGWRFDLEAPGTRAAHYLVNTDSVLASQVGLDVLDAGGNAIDAAVSVAFALSVVYPEAGNLGGGGFAMVRSADGTRAALDFRETAPAAAGHDQFLDTAQAPRKLAGTELRASQAGHQAAGVPGSVAGLWALHQRFGTKPWSELIRPAVALAEHGFTVDAEFARSAAEALPRLREFAGSRALFLPAGRLRVVGDRFTNPDLGRVLQRIADEGRGGFYGGETARLMLREMQRGDGLITADDLAHYEVRWREPISAHYRGYEIVSMPPPSSGGAALALLAGLLEGYPLADVGWHSARHLHLLAEAMSRAFADRNALLGDPDFVRVPLQELLAPAYAAARRADISERATPSSLVHAGLPPPEGNHTTHFAVVDAEGAAVALTTTINDLYGSGVTVTGAGFLLNDEMDDFAIQPGTPNLYGLVQGENNAIVPRKRMLSSLAPTLVLDAEGRVRIVAGARGGPRIISATWQVISNVLDFGMTATSAVSAPRVHHQWQPDELAVETGGLLATTEQELEALGHHLQPVADLGSAPLIVRDVGAERWVGVPDPRRGGAALGR